MKQIGNDRALSPAKILSRPNGHAPLTCATCQGHLVADLYIDTVDAGGHVWVRALRCVGCRKLADVELQGFSTPAQAGRIGRIPRELPEWGLSDEMTALGT